MSWAVGYDSNWRRHVGYGVPAFCDHPGCMAQIDRGIAHTCGGAPYGGDQGCGLHFCGDHLCFYPQLCLRCIDAGEDGVEPFKPSEEHPTWAHHVLTDPSWAEWRAENPLEVHRLVSRMLELASRPTHAGEDAGIAGAFECARTGASRKKNRRKAT